MQVLIFEDQQVSRFLPLAALKPVYGIRSGCRTLQQRFEEELPADLRLCWHMRPHIAPWFREANPGTRVNELCDEELLLLNGRLVCDQRVAALASGNGVPPGMAIVQEGSLVACRLAPSTLPQAIDLRAGLFDGMAIARQLSCTEASDYLMYDNLWDPVALHPDLMQHDRDSFPLGIIDGEVHPSAVLVNPSAISVARGAVVMAGAVLDASEGYIHIGEEAVVEPQAVLMRNVVLGAGARAKIGAKIYSNVYVGGMSKAGGEIEDSVIEPYANKQHDGFLGHSYIASWCNLGAATNTSDLKNNYGKVSLTLEGRRVPTGLQFLGLLMGEHSKCAIGTLFNTGTVVGTSANVFGAGMPPKEVPSFSWGNGHPAFEPCEVDKVLETARTVMSRRRVAMSEAYAAMFRHAAASEPLRPTSR